MSSTKALAAIAAVLTLGAGAWTLSGLFDPTTEDDASLDAGLEVSIEDSIRDAARYEIDPDTGETETEPVDSREILALRAADTEELTSSPDLTIHGRVTDMLGNPLAGVTVNLHMRHSGNVRGRGRFSWREYFRSRPLGKPLTTGSDGRFRLRSQVFAEASFEVTAQDRNHAPGILRKQWKLETGTESPSAGAEPELELGDLKLDDGTAISGFVTNTGGVALAGAEVRWQPSDRRNWWNYRRLSELLPKISTDADGRFEMTALPKGKYRVVAVAPKHVPGMSEVIDGKPGYRKDGVKITLELGASLTGTVRDAEGNPIAKASVSIEGSDANRRQIEAMLRERTAALGRLKAQNPGSTPRDPQIDALRQQLARVRNEWRQLSRISRAQTRDQTDTNGRFQFDGLPKGAVRLRARHGKFIDASLDPIDPARTPEIEVRMDKRLALAGVVIDSATGAPLTHYGIKVRSWRTRGNNPAPWGRIDNRRGRRGPDNRRDPRAAELAAARARAAEAKAAAQRAKALDQLIAKASPAQRAKLMQRQAKAKQRAAQLEARRLAAQNAQQQRDLAREAARKQHEAYLEDRLGPSGITPHRPDKPTGHAGGRYELPDLQPGGYVIDVAAPGYISEAFGPFELVKGEPPPTPTLQLRRGFKIAGRVTAKTSGTPISNARVELYLPPLNPGNRTNQTELQKAMRPPSNGIRVESVRSGGDGGFEFSPLRPGNFRIRVMADGYASVTEKNLTLTGLSDLQVAVSLSKGATIHGYVTNLAPGQRAMVVLASTLGARKFVPVDEKTGRYSATGLDAGSYFVRLQLRGSRGMGFMRYLVEAAMNPDMRPDVTVVEEQEARFDLNAAANATGGLKGTVTLNQVPTAGLEIILQQDKNGVITTLESTQRGQPGSGRVRRMLQGLLHTRSGRNGSFALENVPPGDYILEVRRPARGNQKPRALHRETLRITEGATQTRQLHLLTGKLSFEITDDGNNKPLRRARILLASSQESRGVEPKKWRTLPSFQIANLRNGKAGFRDLAVGEYEYLVYQSGYQTLRSSIYISTGESTPRQLLHIQRRAKKKAKKKATPKPANKG